MTHLVSVLYLHGSCRGTKPVSGSHSVCYVMSAVAVQSVWSAYVALVARRSHGDPRLEDFVVRCIWRSPRFPEAPPATPHELNANSGPCACAASARLPCHSSAGNLSLFDCAETPGAYGAATPPRRSYQTELVHSLVTGSTRNLLHA